MDSSSSGSESGSEGEEELGSGVTPTEGQLAGEAAVESAGGGEMEPPGGGDDPGDVSDDEMASAVASASHQASKFLQDSDSEEDQEKHEVEEQEKEGMRSGKADFDNVFGEESDDEQEAAGPSRSKAKRLLSSGDEGQDVGSDRETTPKRRRLSSGEGPSVDKEEDRSGSGDVLTKESSFDPEEGSVGGASGEGVFEEGAKSDGEGSDDEEEGEGRSEAGSSGEGVSLQEEVAELVEEGGEIGGEGEGEERGEPGSDDEVEDDRRGLEGMSDWDIMMERRKAAMARARRKRRRDGDLTVNDDHIMALIQQMRDAAQQDRQLNLARKAATKKIQLLSTVVTHLKKSDLQTTFIECGILSVLSEWLTPLPDNSLPHLKIRESILDILKSYPVPDSSILKSSKIGKAVMLLYKHPKEAKKNKLKAGKIINEWARPIFGLASDFKSMTRDEREERDYANLSQEARRRISSGERRPSQDDDTEQPQKPGDKGWVGRARVPMPSTKGYVVRPKWNIDSDQYLKKTKKSLDRYEKHLRKKRQESMQNKTTHAVPISIEGRRMPL